MKITDKYVFFWNGIYSQWFLADMVTDSITFNSCEQYMMYRKALLFGDKEIADEILFEEDPREQKKWGRKIKNFNKDIWEQNCLSIVYQGNLAKFTQNEDLKRQLLLTGDRMLVEASPVDQIWGIKMGENDKGVDNPVNWRGLNLLGQVLNLVKNTLK
jgi:ribA/ribD-fused uncharacterized protein